MDNFVIVKQYTFNPKFTSNIDFLVKNQQKTFTTKGLNPVQVNNKSETLKNYNLTWEYDCKKRLTFITGKLINIANWITNYYDINCSLSDTIKYINKLQKQQNENKIKKEKKEMVKKQQTKLEKVFNLLKSGKKVKIQTIAKKVYGSDSEYSIKKARTAISDLRTSKGYEIQLVGKGIYQL